ncbi:hypothetical protein D3C80_1357360 [compost metagenome]
MVDRRGGVTQRDTLEVVRPVVHTTDVQQNPQCVTSTLDDGQVVVNTTQYERKVTIQRSIRRTVRQRTGVRNAVSTHHVFVTAVTDAVVLHGRAFRSTEFFVSKDPELLVEGCVFQNGWALTQKQRGLKRGAPDTTGNCFHLKNLYQQGLTESTQGQLINLVHSITVQDSIERSRSPSPV